MDVTSVSTFLSALYVQRIMKNIRDTKMSKTQSRPRKVLQTDGKSIQISFLKSIAIKINLQNHSGEKLN